MTEMRSLVDDQALDLMKHRRMRLVRIAAIGAARADHTNGRLLAEHRAHLHRGRVRAQQHPRAIGLWREIKGVVHFPRRVAFREIQLGEVIVIRLDIGTFGDSETHVGENRSQLVGDLADRVDPTGFDRRLANRQRDIDSFGVQSGVECGRGKFVFCRSDGRGDPILQSIDCGTLYLALIRRHGAECLQQRRHRAALAERRNAHCFQCRFVFCRGDACENFLL